MNTILPGMARLRSITASITRSTRRCHISKPSMPASSPPDSSLRLSKNCPCIRRIFAPAAVSRSSQCVITFGFSRTLTGSSTTSLACVGMMQSGASSATSSSEPKLQETYCPFASIIIGVQNVGTYCFECMRGMVSAAHPERKVAVPCHSLSPAGGEIQRGGPQFASCRRVEEPSIVPQAHHKQLWLT